MHHQIEHVIVITLWLFNIAMENGTFIDGLPWFTYELDDGWPESVEEQGLLLLVWRHHITKQYIKDVL